jgi:hypothetical protein
VKYKLPAFPQLTFVSQQVVPLDMPLLPEASSLFKDLKVFVAGGTGATGRLIIERLLKEGVPVRALARDLAAAVSSHRCCGSVLCSMNGIKQCYLLSSLRRWNNRRDEGCRLYVLCVWIRVSNFRLGGSRSFCRTPCKLEVVLRSPT